MGRGRQKAKHTKIARELKSFSPSVNYSALERELGHPDADENSYEDKWADEVGEDEEEGDGEEETPRPSTSTAIR